MKLGFQFVPFPREIWTENIDLTQAEFRLLGWLCCGLRFGVAQIRVADHQVLSGFKDEHGVVYPPAGLSKNSLRRARESLVERKMLKADQLYLGGGRGNQAGWVYSLNLSELEQFSGNPPNFDPKPSQVGPETLPTLTLNPPNFDPLIRKERSTEEPEEAEKDKTSVSDSLFTEGVVVDSKKPNIPEWVPPDTWGQFVAMRKQIKAPLTDHAMELAVRALGKLRTQGHDPGEVLEQSIFHCWRGLFPLKDGNNGRPTRADERQERNRRIITTGLSG